MFVDTSQRVRGTLQRVRRHFTTSLRNRQKRSADQVLRRLMPFFCEGDEAGVKHSVCYKQSQYLFNEVQCLFNKVQFFRVMQVEVYVQKSKYNLYSKQYMQVYVQAICHTHIKLFSSLLKHSWKNFL